MLTASFLSTLAGVHLPGMESLIHNVNVNFHNPVFIGDVLTVAGEVREKDERFKMIKIKIKISNQKSIRVVSGSMQIGLI
jgi:3-hydroxybutyryl-CoA dehydratase